MAINPSKVDLSKISISAPKTMDNGGKMLYLNYGGGINSLYVTTPEVEVPFDPSYFADNENSGKYSVKFSMKDLDNNKNMRDFHTWATSMDSLLLQKASENSQSWFRKAKLSDETLKELYTPMVKVSVDPETGEPNGKYPDSFAFKINKRDGKFKDFSIYDANKNVFDVDGTSDNPTEITKLIVKGAMIKVVLKCNGIWVANGKFGCTWKAEQVRVKVPEGGLQDFAIMSDSDDSDDSDDEDNTPLARQVSKVVNMVEDSSDEEQGKDVMFLEKEDVSTEPEPEPEPEPEKKKVVKKVRKVKRASAE
tara:strand:+ start:308 stop:1228 length:921 start_codon:yes stop_codon:yes gene_type:complete